MSVHNYSGCVFWTGAWLALYQGPGDSGRWDGSYFFCWLPAVGSIARKEPPWMTPGSSACVDRTVLLLKFPCLSAPSGRSNTNPQPQFLALASGWGNAGFDSYISFMLKLSPFCLSWFLKPAEIPTVLHYVAGEAARQQQCDWDAIRDWIVIILVSYLFPEVLHPFNL